MDENIGRNFSPLNVFACFSTTRRAMNKWIAQSDSAHQTGLGPTPTGVSDCRLLMVYKGVKIQPTCLGAIFVSRNFILWVVSPQPLILWANGGHRRIQAIKLV